MPTIGGQLSHLACQQYVLLVVIVVEENAEAIIRMLSIDVVFVSETIGLDAGFRLEHGRIETRSERRGKSVELVVRYVKIVAFEKQYSKNL